MMAEQNADWSLIAKQTGIFTINGLYLITWTWWNQKTYRYC